MHLLSPLWLGALAAVALPVALHLLSRGRGRRVPLASTRLLETGLSVRGRRLQPSDLALLALRAAILAGLAVALARPWTEAPAARGGTSWLLLDPGFTAAADTADAATVARWRGEAAEIRFLAAGLPSRMPSAPPRDAPDAWSLLREADRLAPRGTELRVVTRGRLAELRGERPALEHRTVWLGEPFGTAGRPEPVLASAGPTREGLVRVGLRVAGARGSAFEPRDLPLGTSADGIATTAAGERVTVRRGDRALSIAMAAPVAIAMHAAAARTAGAAAWRAACEDGARALGAGLRWGELPEGSVLRFWLDDAPAPAAWRDGGRLATEAGSPGVPCAARRELDGDVVRLERCEEQASATLLVENGSGATAASHLTTRLDAAWSALGDTAIPARVCARWLEEALVAGGAIARADADDPRAVAAAQRAPATAGAPAGGAAEVERRSLEAPAWLALAALVAAERVWAMRRAPRGAPGAAA